jgi:DNA-directed RNA polymerase specialized sigma24 family protein
MKSLRRKLLKGLESKRKITKLDKGYDSASQIVFSIEEEIIKGEDRSRRTKYLKQGLQELNAKQREILYYKFTLGYDYPQICEIMTITYDSARQSVSRAIYSLKQFVSKNNFILMLFWR